MKLIIYSLLCCFLASCATTGKFENKLKNWIGKSENDLISVQGIPNGTYSLNDGGKLVMYHLNGGSAVYPIGNMYFTENYWCKVTFTIDGTGTITNWKHEGNKCESY